MDNNNQNQLERQSSYKDHFRRIKPRTIQITKELITAKPWWGNPGRGGAEEAARAYGAFCSWLREASRIYRISVPWLFILPDWPGHGCYNAESNIIVLPKFSITTLAHEFRHALQYQKPIPVRSIDQAEEDARGWSVSLIYQANPAFYERAKRKGLLLFS